MSINMEEIMDKVACIHQFPPLDIDRNIGNYTRRIGTIQRVTHLICLRMDLLTDKVNNNGQISEQHWNYFLLAINEHPIYQVRNRTKIALHDFHELAKQFWEDHGEKRIETLMCWTLWLIQRDLHPLYYLIPRVYPVVRSYEEAQLYSGLPSTAYVESDMLQQITDRKKAQREKLEMLIAQGRGNSQDALGLAKAVKRIHPNEYVYGNCFDNFELYLNQDFLDPKTLLLGQYIGSRDWFDCDYGTYDRVAKAKNYQRKPKKTDAYNKMTDPELVLKFPEGCNVSNEPFIAQDTRLLVNLMGIRQGSNFRDDFNPQRGQIVQPKGADTSLSNGWVDFDQLPMSQARKQAEQLFSPNEHDQTDDWDDDYFNSETYWKESNPD
ncbi:hypothetical protein MUB04_14675 [Acinetobacter indicus]|uniref:hypothetical protein n=1 Tax=Acinetobacter TaxID=469 RepID=UPI0015D1C97F|nr:MULTISPECIES: hypothetical protein [Acinetobacter]MCP0917777.1 hypothetical protein [Acinetobacter indicus]